MKQIINVTGVDFHSNSHLTLPATFCEQSRNQTIFIKFCSARKQISKPFFCEPITSNDIFTHQQRYFPTITSKHKFDPSSFSRLPQTVSGEFSLVPDPASDF
jgi:hypothetical protein